MTIETAVTSVAPRTGRGRGRAPIILKGGKPYAQARDEAKAGVAAAKSEVRNATTVLKAAEKAENTAAAVHQKALTAQGKAQAAFDAPPNSKATKEHVTAAKAATKTALANAKQAVKDTAAAFKTAQKNTDALRKNLERAKAALGKAEADVVKVEEQKLAAAGKLN